MADKTYKPHIPSDEKYIQGVADSIRSNGPQEDLSFSLLNDVFTAVGISEDPYHYIAADRFEADKVQALGERAFEAIQARTTDESLKSKLMGLWDYLAQADPLEKADLIFVFGGPGDQRINEAVRLYKEGYAGKILVTGQKASYMQDVDVTEAEHYSRLAQEQGVPAGDLIVENEAKNTPENAVNSVKILKGMDWQPSTIIAITLPYHMRRCYCTLKAVADWKPNIIHHPVRSAKYTREDFFLHKNGCLYVFSEFIKLYAGRVMGHF